MKHQRHGRWTHSKAQEELADVTFHYEGREPWRLSVPIKCRRAHLELETDEEIDAYLDLLHAELHPNNHQAFRDYAEEFWKGSRSAVTKPIFDAMAQGFEWLTYSDISARSGTNSSNAARRLQELKDAGFTIGTRSRAGSSFEFMLLPKLPTGQTGYEWWSGALRARIVRALDSYDAYEGKRGNPKHLLPDHKFPEARWDRDTRRETLEGLTDAEILADFQLITNQRNQQKREVCRACRQTGRRGSPFGVKFYYEGTEEWPRDVPQAGKAAEAGCVGCGWYDLQAWRATLQRTLPAS